MKVANCPIFVGTAVNIAVEFKATVNDALADPSSVSLLVRKPTGAIATYVYGVDADLIKDTVGKYHMIVLIDKKGRWDFQYTGSGGVSVVNSSFIIAEQGVSA